MKGLSAKQQRFIEELRADKNRNATAAYRRANPDCKNDNVAAAASARLLRSVKVKEAIMAADEESLKRAEITADWVLERMRIEALREGEGASHSARVTALKLLGSCHNLFPDKHEVTGRNGTPLIPVAVVELVMPAEETSHDTHHANGFATANGS